jgi:hypothetical protein
MLVGKIPQVAVPGIEIFIITILHQGMGRRKGKAAETSVLQNFGYFQGHPGELPVQVSETKPHVRSGEGSFLLVSSPDLTNTPGKTDGDRDDGASLGQIIVGLGFFGSMSKPLHGSKTHHVRTGIHGYRTNFLEKPLHLLPPTALIELAFLIKDDHKGWFDFLSMEFRLCNIAYLIMAMPKGGIRPRNGSS